MTTSTPVSPDRAGAAGPAGSRRGSRLLAVVAAVAAAAAVWVVAVPVLGVDLRARMGSTVEDVGIGAVVGSALLAALLGWALLALLERRSERAAAIWSGVAGVVLLLSLAGPLTSGVGATATVVMVLMHLAVAAVLVPALRRTSPSR